MHLAQFSASLASFCEKWSKSAEMWQSFDKHKFARFFKKLCSCVCSYLLFILVLYVHITQLLMHPLHIKQITVHTLRYYVQENLSDKFRPSLENDWFAGTASVRRFFHLMALHQSRPESYRHTVWVKKSPLPMVFWNFFQTVGNF